MRKILHCSKLSLCCILILVMMLFMFTGCEQSLVVNENLNSAANNFECYRKITVYNARTDLVIMEMEGCISLSNNSSSELVVTCKTGENEFKKNYIYLNEYVLYVVEDITGTVTDPYHYKVHFYTPIPDIDINK